MTDFEKRIIANLTDKSGNFIAQKINERYLKKIGYYEYLINRYNDNTTDKLIEILHRIKNDIDVVPRCKGCGNPVVYSRNVKGYPTYCSKKCANSDPEVLRKNAESVSKANKKAYEERKEEILQKRANTLKDITGKDNTGSPFCFEEVREKAAISRRNTLIEKHKKNIREHNTFVEECNDILEKNRI